MITRRAFLLGASAVALACNPATEGDQNNMIPPWHMWGATAPVRLERVTGGPTFLEASAQLARINYKRPESWRFLFFAHVFRSQISNAIPVILDVEFSVQTGVGRGNLNLNPFENFRFILPVGSGGSVSKWSGSVNAPVRDDTLSPPEVPLKIDAIVGEDIQIGYHVSCSIGGVVGDVIDAEVGVALAPWHHARPDWEVHKFVGEELHGK